MLAFEGVGKADHRIFVERIGMVVRVRPVKGAAEFSADDAVLVSLRDSVKARMKIGLRFFGCKDADGAGQQAVDGAP